VKTKRRILDLARNTLEGHRGDAHQEFRAVVAANGYEMSRGGWVKFGGENVCRGWEAFAYMVSATQEIVLRDVPRAEVAEVAREAEAREYAAPTETRAPLDVVASPDEDLDTLASASAMIEAVAGKYGLDLQDVGAATAAGYAPEDGAVEITYLYTTRIPTVRLGNLTEVRALLVEEATAVHEGPCQSGAALDCAGTGFLRILPESMLSGSDRESMIQCVPCYEASALAYVRKLHRYEA
jgi:hypothetical protein